MPIPHCPAALATAALAIGCCWQLAPHLHPPPPLKQPCKSSCVQIMGNPVSTSSGTDPGLWLGSIFVVNNISAQFSSASGCSSSVTTKITTSASQYQNSFSQSVGVSAEYGSSSFSSNVDYQKQNSGTDSNKAFTFISGSIAQVAIGQLKPLTTIGMKLDPSFLQLATEIRDSTLTTRDGLLLSMYQGYGT